MSRARIGGAVVLLVACVSVLLSPRALTAAGTHVSSSTYGFLVDGGHLYLPYVYVHWSQRGALMTGTLETLESSSAQDGYVVRRRAFTGREIGGSLSIRFLSPQSEWVTGWPQFRFSAKGFFIRESQTGTAWWGRGVPMSPAQWALNAVRFMECYANSYDAGNPRRKCTNKG